MTTGLREIRPEELHAELEGVLAPRLVATLRARGAGHCMRVDDVDVGLMARLCSRLRAEVPDAQVWVLSDGRQDSVPPALAVSSTKLVELRNSRPDGTLRPPLLVFVPGELRAAAEDSFGVATFEEVILDGAYEQLTSHLLDSLAGPLRTAIEDVLNRLREAAWPFADPVAVARFLLTVRLNDGDPDAAGAALFELGLVPDFEVFKDPDRAASRLDRNQRAVTTLTWSSRSERGRVLELGLSDRGLRTQLAGLVADTGLEDPRSWIRRIVTDRANWALAFHRWRFVDDDLPPDQVDIEIVDLDLPVAGEREQDERLQRLVGQRYLPVGSKGRTKFSVTFRVDPSPRQVRGLARFAVEVIAQDGGSVGLVRTMGPWRSAKNDAKVTFSGLNRVDWEEGWHFVRVRALTDQGEPLPIRFRNGVGRSGPGDTRTPPGSSDLFYVLLDGQVEVTPPQGGVARDASLVHAWRRLQFAAVREDRDPAGIHPIEVRWRQRTGRGRPPATELLEASFGRDGVAHIPVSAALGQLEQRILREPGILATWRVPITSGQGGEPERTVTPWPVSPARDALLEARGRYFDAVRAGDRELVTQAADLQALSEAVVAYAEAFESLVAELLQRAEAGDRSEGPYALDELRTLLQLDTVTLDITGYRGDRRRAVLVAPTHPLRALWLATWSAVGDAWLRTVGDGGQEYATAAKQALLSDIAPLGFPSLVPYGAGQLLAAVDNLTPFWTLHAPTGEGDPRGLVGDVCAALGLPEPAISGTLITGASLAGWVSRYLAQHPYVRTLSINAFNPGRAGMLAEMLLELQRNPRFADLRYDLRLFVTDPELPGTGERLAGLLTPDAGSTREADAFSTVGATHLRPKLALAVRSTSEFRDASDRHRAHLTFLFDVFTTEDVGVVQAASDEVAPVHGLIQDFQVDYTEDEHTVAWRRRPRHGRARDLVDAEELTDLLSSLPRLLSVATATVATGQVGAATVPVTTLRLETEDRSLLQQAHKVSDWVVTVDRSLGIEFFDHGGRQGRPDYLIDHSRNLGASSGHQVVVTSRSLTELETLARPLLEQFGLPHDRVHAVMLLDQLRYLSGRLAFKLASTATQRSEALGLALARLYLGYQGVLANQALVPLDAHLDLYQEPRERADEFGDDFNLRRTDLALFDLDAARRLITCRLVEVKCYTGRGLTGWNALKDGIAGQLGQSERVLAGHFAPRSTSSDRPDRLVKTHQLVTLLRFYLDRAVRYRLFESQAEREARVLLATLEQGYELVFTKTGLIFDFTQPRTDPVEQELAVEYHRIGKDLALQLLDAARPPTAPPGTESLEPTQLAAEHAANLASQDLSIPRLTQAAFLAQPRQRAIPPLSPEPPPLDPPPVPTTPPPLGTAAPTHSRTDLESQTDDHPGTPTRRHVVDLGASDRSVAETSRDWPSIEAQSSTPAVAAPADRLVGVPAATAPAAYDILLGADGATPQYGLLGEVAGRKVALDLNETHTISLFGVQGGGKSYTLGTIAEMASLPIAKINALPRPLATVIFHYSPTQDYVPEFTSMAGASTDEAQLALLHQRYDANPKALGDVVLLVPDDQLAQRRAEYPSLAVHPLKFASSELKIGHWRFLMGAVGNQATYIRQLNRIMREHRDGLTLERIRVGIEDSRLADHIKELAHQRLDLAAGYIDDSTRLSELIRPGRLIIVDLRDEFIEKDESLGLFVVLLQLFADARYEGEPFNKLVVFDEAHKYIDSPDLVAGLVEVVREMRHKGVSIMVASQDPPSVPVSLIELSSEIILHRFGSPAWLKHVQKANAALAELTPTKMANLKPGEAYVWSSKATDAAFSHGAVKVTLRPRVTQHGGATKTAVRDS